jgi:hypothetical protein
MTVAPPARRPTTAHAPGRRLTPVAALATAAVLLAGCGGDEASTTNAAATTAGGPPRPALADDVPARTAAYAEATLRPDGDAGAALEQLKGLVGGGGRHFALGRSLDIDHGLLAKGRTLEEDVLPHLGEHAAAFLLGGTPVKAGDRTAAKTADGALVTEVRDAAALRKAVATSGTEEQVGDQRIRVKDGHAVWIGDRIAAVGTERAVRAAIAAADGDDLSRNGRFTAALAQLRTTSPVGLSWVDLQQAPSLNAAVAELLAAHGTKASGAKGGASARGRAKDARAAALDALPKDVRKRLEQRLGGKGSGAATGSPSALFGLSPSRLRVPARDATAAMALELRPGRLTVRTGGTGASATDPKAAADAVAALPAGSWAAFGGSTSGLLAKGSPGAGVLDRLSSVLGTKLPDGLRDALAGVEVASGGVQGQSLLAAGGAVVLRAKDAAGAKALLDQIGTALGGRTGLTAKQTKIDGTDAGLVAGLPGLPLQLAAGVRGDRLALGLGAPSVTKALGTESRLSSDPVYAKAKGLLDGTAPSLILQPGPLTDLLGSLGDLGDMFGGAGGTGGLGGLLGQGGSGGSGQGGGGGTGSRSGLDLDDLLSAVGRVKLVTAGREATGSSTWRGSVVVEYDATAKKPTTP